MSMCKQFPPSARCYAVDVLRDVYLSLEADPESATCAGVRRIAHCRWLPGFRFIEPRFQPVFLGFVLRGHGLQYDAEGVAHHLGAGSLLVCGGGSCRGHAVDGNEGLELIFLVTQSRRMAGFARAALPALPVAFGCQNAGEFEDLLRILLREGARMGRGSVAVCNRISEALFLLARASFAEHHEKPPRREMQFLRIRRHIQKHAARRLTVSHVARANGVSRAYLARLFSEYAGETPLRHMQRQQMAYAVEQLQNGANSVKEVAHALGFDDPAAFSRAFRRIIGKAPSRFL